MKQNYKKSLKFITLLITALLIATVSAATYRYMYIDGSVTVGTAKMIWIEGADSPGDATISGSTYTADLDVEPGTPMNFSECVFLKNQDASAHNLTISITTAISAGAFDECKMHIYENSTASWVYIDTLDLTNSADTYETYTGNDPLGTGEYYRMTFEVNATLTASGTYNFDIQVEYE
jgi:hypothetical protein